MHAVDTWERMVAYDDQMPIIKAEHERHFRAYGAVACHVEIVPGAFPVIWPLTHDPLFVAVWRCADTPQTYERALAAMNTWTDHVEERGWHDRQYTLERHYEDGAVPTRELFLVPCFAARRVDP